WAQIEPGSETMVRYAGSDVLDTAAVAAKLPPVDPVVYERERAFQQMTARVSYEGVRVDGEHVAELTETHRQQRSELARQLRERGVDNPGSNVQVGEALVRAGAQDLPLSEKSGKPSVAADVLEKVKAQGGDAGQLAEAVLGWRQHQKALSAFLEPYDTLVRHGDGRARPTIYTLSADTGRTSCVRPNAQQLPRSGGFRACFTADPGELIISADFSGVEIRVAAALSQDEALMRFIHDEDAGLSDGLHWAIAREVWGPEATKAERYAAKAIVFGCVPLDTLILTKRGWLRHDEVRVGDETIGCAPDGSARWTRITKVHHYDDAPWVRLAHGQSGGQATVTPDHRGLTDKRKWAPAGQPGPVVRGFEETNQLTTQSNLVLSARLASAAEVDITEEEAAL